MAGIIKKPKAYHSELRLLGIALDLKNECPQKTNYSTSYTITLLSPKIGQEKTGFSWGRKEISVVKKNFLLER